MDKIMHFFVIVVIFQCFFVFGIGKVFESLALIAVKKGEEYTLQFPHAKLIELDGRKFDVEYGQSISWNNIHHFCPLSNRTNLVTTAFQENNKHNLYFLEKTGKTKTKKICSENSVPIINQVKDANLENIGIYLYVSGYKVFIENLENLKLKSNLNDKGFLFVSTILYYYEESFGQAVAVRYQLLPSKMYKKLWDDELDDFYDSKLLDFAHYNRFFEENLSYPIVMNNERGQAQSILHRVTRIPLASPDHFISGLEQKSSFFKINSTPILKNFEKYVKKIDEFLKIVAKNVGKLHITSGITKIGFSIEKTNEIVEDEDLYKKITMPDFIWKIVEFKSKTKTYGILLIVPNSPEPIKNDICGKDKLECRDYGWKISDDTRDFNKISCCKLTKQSIQNLYVDFLELKEREIFNLKF